MKLQPVHLTGVVGAIETEFDFVAPHEITALGVASEQLRALVSTDAEEPFNFSRYPVPTVRLTNELRARLAPLWSFVEEEDGNYALEQLEELGRIGELIKANGRWYLAPLRLLEIDSANYLLLGGGPSFSLPHKIKKELQIVGRARILNRTAENRSLLTELCTQRIDTWLQVPNSDVFAWASAFLREQMRAQRTGTDDLQDASVYIPHRWVPLSEYKEDRLTILYRQSVSIFGNRSYRYGLAKVSRVECGELRILATADIERDDARRLQGVFWEEGRRRRIRYFVRGSLIAIPIPFPLPAPENKFLSLGWTRGVSVNPKQWPKEYIFSKRLLPLIEKILSLMGYELYKDQ